jgi:hypothetical protein
VERQRSLLDDSTGAEFSRCRTWRYALWRVWGAERADKGKFCAFIGLNPSTADETRDDPTIRRCIGFAKAWGYQGLYMLNLFGFRATDPKAMQAAADPIGPGNDRAIAFYAERCELLVAAWGAGGVFQNRGAEVAAFVRQRGRDLHCLGLTEQRLPRHPLYMPSWTEPQLYAEDPQR